MPGIDYTLGMKTSGFDAGIKGALGKLASIGSAAAKLTAGVGLAAGAGAAALIVKSIGKAADMETLRTAFIPLLGGIQEAKDRMAELSRFAAATPFELPEIATASKTLETLTRGALSTGKGLTLVGDIASATNQPFSEIAVTVGRMYDGLQSGRPIGEVMQRLQELGVISGDTRGRLEALQKSGASGPDAWNAAEAALTRFSGSMKLQSGTWNGLLSTFKDTISEVMIKFGEPIMDSLKPYLEGAISRIESLKDAAKQAGETIANAFSVISAAFQSGDLMKLAGVSLKLGFIEAVNFLAKGVQAATSAFREGLRMTGIWGAVESVFIGIAKKFSAEILDSLSNVTGLGGLKKDAERKRMEGGAELYFARKEFDALSLGEGAPAFVAKFKSAFASIPDLIPTEETRQQFEQILSPLTATAAADSVFREVFAEQAAAAVTGTKPAAPADALAATAAATGRTTPISADRLAQIGGYVGRGASGLAQKAADATAKWTQKTASNLDKLLARPLTPAVAVF